MSKKEMSEDELIAMLTKVISEAEHINDGKLAKEREEVERYYRGEYPEPMHKGDAKYVSRDVFDAVDSMRSTVLEAYSANNRIVFFKPEKGETVDDAKQATEYCRHVFFKNNCGEDIMYDVLSEALMKRFAIAKVYYEENTEEDEFIFDGLTMEELTASLDGVEDYEFKETSVDETTGLLSGTYTVPKKHSCIKVEVIQPEDFLIRSGSSSLDQSKAAIHRTEKSKSDLLKEGYPKKKVEQITFGERNNVYWNMEKQRRFDAVEDVIGFDETDESERDVTVYEIYIYLDRERTGKTKLWKIVLAQDVILEEEEVARMPFVSFVPIPTAHTYHGENFAKSVIPIQNARTVLIRQIINHSLITNNARMQVLNGTVLNPNELIDNRLGGVVNVRRMDGVAPLPQAPLNPFVFNLIQMIDEDKEEVTGISKLSQGMNKDAISTQNAQGMVEQLISASQQRQKIIARRFGHFLRDLFLLIYRTAMDHIDEDEYVAVTGQYVPVNPKEWKDRTAASVELTLGYGEAAMEAQKWVEIDQYFSKDPVLSKGYGYDKRFEVITRGMEARGVEDVRSLLTPPEEMKPPQPTPAEMLQMEQAKTQIELQKAQAQAMLKKADTDLMRARAELLKAQTDAGYKQADIELETERLGLERFVGLAELQLAATAPNQSANYNPDI